jgi:hypothetical protein
VGKKQELFQDKAEATHSCVPPGLRLCYHYTCKHAYACCNQLDRFPLASANASESMHARAGRARPRQLGKCVQANFRALCFFFITGRSGFDLRHAHARTLAISISSMQHACVVFESNLGVDCKKELLLGSRENNVESDLKKTENEETNGERRGRVSVRRQAFGGHWTPFPCLPLSLCQRCAALICLVLHTSRILSCRALSRVIRVAKRSGICLQSAYCCGCRWWQAVYSPSLSLSASQVSQQEAGHAPSNKRVVLVCPAPLPHNSTAR